eukprot:scaffold133310_cov66-Phaeocystis_antarctica.AAC.5
MSREDLKEWGDTAAEHEVYRIKYHHHVPGESRDAGALDHQRVVVVPLAWGNPAPARGMVHWLVGWQAALLAAEDAQPAPPPRCCQSQSCGPWTWAGRRAPPSPCRRSSATISIGRARKLSSAGLVSRSSVALCRFDPSAHPRVISKV